MSFKHTKELFPFLFICFLFLMISCSDPDTNKANQNEPSESLTLQIPEPTSVCYAFVTAADTVELQLLIQSDQTVTGNLLYKLSGKDSNRGTIKGTIKNDTIIADYNFLSEGKESMRQIAFLKTDSLITEGYGPVEEVNGMVHFKQGAAIDFSKGLKLFLTNCQN